MSVARRIADAIRGGQARQGGAPQYGPNADRLYLESAGFLLAADPNLDPDIELGQTIRELAEAWAKVRADYTPEQALDTAIATLAERMRQGLSITEATQKIKEQLARL